MRQKIYHPGRRRLSGEPLESRYLLSAVAFVARSVVSESEANGASSVHAADLDGDGDMDVLSVSFGNNTIAWYENADGKGTFAAQRIITTTAGGASSVFAADLDGDGDLDVLSASAVDDTIAWYENSDGKGTFREQWVITAAAGGARSVHAMDLDGDGDLDVVSASAFDDTIAWYENQDGRGTFGDPRLIAIDAEFAWAVFAADVDGDGDADVLSASPGDSTIAWHENTDGKGSFGQRRVIDIAPGGPSSVVPADVDGDGDLDVLSTFLFDRINMVAWYENTDGNGTFGQQQVITAESDIGESVFAADLDGDGDLDVLSASHADNGLGKIAWYENTDGKGSFGAQQVITTAADGAVSVFAADLDGDGDLDVLSASSNDDKIAWYENTDGRGSYGTQRTIAAISLARTPWSVIVADVDGDGDPDVLSTSLSDDKIAWYENTDGNGAFGAQREITNEAGGARSVFAADVDGDGDADVLAASSHDNKIAWYENTDGKGLFGPQQVITTGALLAWSVFAADVDGDGDLDILSASQFDDKIAWYENTNGAGQFGPPQIIITSARGASSVVAADVDGDGDEDVLSASQFDNTIAWYENTNGTGLFGPPQVITTLARNASSVFAADVDGDGDVDVLSASPGDDKIAWYQNTDGNGTFGVPQIITTGAAFAGSVFAADVDGDGDLDALSASGLDDKIAWYENTDGKGSFGQQQVITTDADGAWSVFAADVDGDGDVDVLSTSQFDDHIAWYENRLAGDMDDNGEVTFGDFLKLAHSFGRGDVLWEDGDIDGDAAVDFSDFLILANNFGATRPPSKPASATETRPLPAPEPISTAAAVDELFGRFSTTDGFYQ